MAKIKPKPGKARCAAKTKRGKRCTMTSNLALDEESGRYLCIWHDPARKGEAHRMRARGSKTQAKRRKAGRVIPNAPKTLAEAAEMASWIAHAILAGDVGAKEGAEAQKAISTFVRAHEKAHLEQEFRAMARELKKLRKERGS